MRRQHKIVFLVFLIVFCLYPLLAFGEVEGQTEEFFVDSDYDLQGRATVSASLYKITDEAYFYVEEDWYDNLTEGEKEKVSSTLETLFEEFSQVIYPTLTENYGTEWKPGIDSDKHITILFHRMPNKAAGYFKTQDETSRLQSSVSNEREMVYLNSYYLFESIIKSYLAHEFTHLITFNQKERIKRQEEEVWLNELRAEYASVMLGYDDEYLNSNLEERIKFFLNYPSNSLTEWTNRKSDYGVISAFGNYLVGHYGKEILTESLQNSQVGIASIQETLEDQHIDKDFWEIFSDWLVAVFLNKCGENDKYCYKNENLEYIKINPSLIFLPPNQKAQLTLTNDTTYWAGNWYRIIGGADNLEIIFDGTESVEFKVPYVLCKENYDCSIGFLELDEKQNTTFSFDDFVDTYTSLTLIPFITSKITGFNGQEEYFDFSLKVTATPNNPEISKQELIAQLQAQIAEIISKIAQLQAQLAEILAQQGECSSITQNLYLGARGIQVTCLQEFLTAQGKEIYPEGQITGYFGLLTQKAVISFQRRYAAEILHPLNITQPTGFVGPSTRTKIAGIQALKQ